MGGENPNPELDERRGTYAAFGVQAIIDRESVAMSEAGLRSFLCQIHELCAGRIAQLDAKWPSREASE